MNPNASGRQSRCLGPLPRLAGHLPAEWWRNLFGATYLKTDGDVIENAQNTMAEVDLVVKALGLKREDHILDLCCGQGRHALELARRGHQHVTGIDASSYLIRLARRRARTAGLEARFQEDDARQLDLPAATFDAVLILGNSFGYCAEAADDERILKAAWRVLRPGGVLALDLADGEWVRTQYEPRSWEWIGPREMVVRERELDPGSSRLICREIVIHTEKGVTCDQFYAERLYDWDRIRGLLEASGFDEVTDQASLLSASDRNQDLGLMARRRLITARAAAPRALPCHHPKRRTTIAVLLGDSGLPDPVKRDGRFNPEDAETLARLKTALADLTEFEFQFLDRHREFLDVLPELKPAFVLNFCDEGFYNEALLEPHVAALLELLGVLYSGSGPACLSLCYNKRLVSRLAGNLDIATPREWFCTPGQPLPNGELLWPVIVKPNFGDGSFGIDARSVVMAQTELSGAIERLQARCPGQPFLIQEFLPGAEYTLTVLGNPETGLKLLPVIQPDFSALPKRHPHILGYESKFLPVSPYWTDVKYAPATLNSADQRVMETAAAKLITRLGCRDYTRFDFRRDAQGAIRFLEVNPNPAWSWDGKMNLAANAAGMSYPELLRRIIEAGLDRAASTHSIRANPNRTD